LVDLDDLERKARDATPGRWTTIRPPGDSDGWATGVAVAALAPRQLVFTDHQGGVSPEANREHIAANIPPVTLALIARVRELEQVSAALVQILIDAFDVDELAADPVYMGARTVLEKGVVLP
jgi:hypothetical protein